MIFWLNWLTSPQSLNMIFAGVLFIKFSIVNVTTDCVTLHSLLDVVSSSRWRWSSSSPSSSYPTAVPFPFTPAVELYHDPLRSLCAIIDIMHRKRTTVKCIGAALLLLQHKTPSISSIPFCNNHSSSSSNRPMYVYVLPRILQHNFVHNNHSSFLFLLLLFSTAAPATHQLPTTSRPDRPASTLLRLCQSQGRSLGSNNNNNNTPFIVPIVCVHYALLANWFSWLINAQKRARKINSHDRQNIYMLKNITKSA